MCVWGGGGGGATGCVCDGAGGGGGGGRGCLEPHLNFQIICNIIIRTFVNNLVLSPR